MDQTSTSDERRMRAALEAARACTEHGDVPVGCVIVRDADAQVVATAGNGRERFQDPTAHAESSRSATPRPPRPHGTWRDTSTLVVTLEPCAMCAGAIVLARIRRVVFGASDPKAGFAGSLGNLVDDPRLNHRVEVSSGVLAEDCGDLLREFFRDRRTP